MNSSLRVTLNASPEQLRGLVALQAAFAQVCNALVPLVQQTRCWNRVTLHHLAYKSLREQFPHIGSQMVCNAIYSVSRTSRLVFQHPASPFHLSRLDGKPLPTLRFLDTSPVYFDRHTLSVKAGTLSMYTLDGRMRFLLSLSEADEKNFHENKLREIVLSRKANGAFELRFWFSDAQDEEAGANAVASMRQHTQIPEYVKVEAAA
ncbi:MAG TPA: hypothetical protein VN649_13835 [Ramlibacter sp.]|nr:hypothetical protein [Ramlibacter sp.]